MEVKKKLFLIDAYALIFRGYYAFIKNPRINSKGLDTSAILGFTNSLFDVIKREKPEFLAVCFDKGGSKDRIKIYEKYKANRDETPEAIKVAVPIIENILNSLGISILVKNGYEADDIIGTISKKASLENYMTYMVTPDKDFAQLVNDSVFIYRPVFGGGYETWGVKEVLEKFEISKPSQVIDFLAMKGDSIDNIPGLPGVGDKTAKKFINEYGSIENLLNNTDKLKGKLKEKIELNKELGILSKKLATIITDVPIRYDINNFTLSPKNLDETKKIFDELEFRRLSTSLNSIFTNSKNIIEVANSLKKNDKSINADFGQFSLFDNQISSNNTNKLELTSQKIISKKSMNLLLSRLKKQKKVSYNLISESDDFSLKEISLCWEKGITYEISKDYEGFKNALKQLFENKNILKISDDLKNDIKLIKNEGITIKGEIFDVKLAHYLINPDISHDLTNLSNSYLDAKIDKNSTELLSGEIANINIQLAELLNKDLEKFKLLELYKSIEIPLLKTLSKMERVGINLDSHFLKNLSKKTTKDLNILKEKIYKIAGVEFNISSPKQLGEVLFERLKISSKPKKTKTGQYSTSEDILAELVDENIIIKLILEYRSISKLLNTYIDSLPKQVSGKSGRIHTQYIQTVASTGRLSSINPNLQNIPIRSERGREIRKAFIPKNKDYFILAADYSQIELRIIASISKEENMINAFKNDEDIHAATASSVFNVPISNVSREQRSNAKIVNFGIIYGVSAFGLSNQTNLNRNESKLLIDTYYKKYPRLKEYISNQISFARNNGYVQTLLGRRRYLKDINSRNAIVRGAAERNAINAPIQGSAADIIKIAMINIQNKLESEDYQSKMLLQVHDELVFDVFKPELNKVIDMVKYEMMNAYQIEVPLKVDINYGLNWLEAH